MGEIYRFWEDRCNCRARGRGRGQGHCSAGPNLCEMSREPGRSQSRHPLVNNIDAATGADNSCPPEQFTTESNSNEQNVNRQREIGNRAIEPASRLLQELRACIPYLSWRVEDLKHQVSTRGYAEAGEINWILAVLNDVNAEENVSLETLVKIDQRVAYMIRMNPFRSTGTTTFPLNEASGSTPNSHEALHQRFEPRMPTQNVAPPQTQRHVSPVVPPELNYYYHPHPNQWQQFTHDDEQSRLTISQNYSSSNFEHIQVRENVDRVYYSGLWPMEPLNLCTSKVHTQTNFGQRESAGMFQVQPSPTPNITLNPTPMMSNIPNPSFPNYSNHFQSTMYPIGYPNPNIDRNYLAPQFRPMTPIAIPNAGFTSEGQPGCDGPKTKRTRVARTGTSVKRRSRVSKKSEQKLQDQTDSISTTPITQEVSGTLVNNADEVKTFQIVDAKVFLGEGKLYITMSDETAKAVSEAISENGDANQMPGT